MHKKILAGVFAAVALCAFSCGSKEKSKPEKESSSIGTEDTTESTAEAANEKAEIPTLADIGERMKEQTAELNDKIESQLNNTDEMDTEARKVVYQFAEAVFGDDAEAMARSMFPAEMLDGMKACGEYDSFKESVTDGETMPLTSVTVKFCVKLKDDEIALAESYMNYYAVEYGLSENKYKVISGYSFMADMESRQEGGVSSSAEGLIIIDIENEGWKIIPISLNELTE